MGVYYCARQSTLYLKHVFLKDIIESQYINLSPYWYKSTRMANLRGLGPGAQTVWGSQIFVKTRVSSDVTMQVQKGCVNHAYILQNKHFMEMSKDV